ncbi:MAG: hypothetical protein ACRDJ9_34490, partial [Dehalococcoidia bacterium]
MEGSLTHCLSQLNQQTTRPLRTLGWEERPDEAPLHRAVGEGLGEGVASLRGFLSAQRVIP